MSSYLPLITGGGGAIVVLCLWVYAFYGGKIHSDGEFTRLEQENAQLREENSRWVTALETERRAMNETAQAGQVTNQLITALTTMAAGRKQSRPLPRGKRPDPAEDMGP